MAMPENDIQEDQNTSGARIGTLAVMGGVAATALLAGRANALGLTYPASFPGTGDIPVLNYALVLEELEAALYQAALVKLPTLGAGSGNAIYTYALEFGQVEQDHATFLRSTITSAGGPAVSRFQYDTNRIDNAAAPRDILELLLQVEATGVRAYLGAIPLFTQSSKYLQIAAAIQATEARHTTALTIAHNFLYQTTLNTAPMPKDNNLTGTFNGSSFKYETYNAAGYNAAAPNEGVAGIDANLSPTAVLAAIAPFIVAPIA